MPISSLADFARPKECEAEHSYLWSNDRPYRTENLEVHGRRKLFFRHLVLEFSTGSLRKKEMLEPTWPRLPSRLETSCFKTEGLENSTILRERPRTTLTGSLTQREPNTTTKSLKLTHLQTLREDWNRFQTVLTLSGTLLLMASSQSCLRKSGKSQKFQTL